ncbi:MAG: hypothetical protein ACYT04_52985 [Nostoc sp.]
MLRTEKKQPHVISRQSRNEEHFQPEARNEVLKEFWLKLTPMSIAVPLRQMWSIYLKTAVIISIGWGATATGAVSRL